jgi:hypothetical protein
MVVKPRVMASLMVGLPYGFDFCQCIFGFSRIFFHFDVFCISHPNLEVL